MNVQIFGVKSSADTRKAQRFFKERRVRIHFVDFKVKGPSRGELRRFMQRFGPEGLIDRESHRFRSLGLRHAHYGPERWLEILEQEPMALRMPLVRCKDRLTVGHQPDAWKGWLDAQ